MPHWKRSHTSQAAVSTSLKHMSCFTVRYKSTAFDLRSDEGVPGFEGLEKKKLSGAVDVGVDRSPGCVFKSQGRN